MNVNPLVLQALNPFGKPVYPDVLPAELFNNEAQRPNEFFTFSYADERPTTYADNTDILDSTVVQVHFFTRGNPQTLKSQIRQALRDKGFNIISTQQTYETDTKYNHVVVEVWIEGII